MKSRVRTKGGRMLGEWKLKMENEKVNKAQLRTLH